MGEKPTDPIRERVASHNVHCPCHSEIAELRAVLKEVGEALGLDEAIAKSASHLAQEVETAIREDERKKLK